MKRVVRGFDDPSGLSEDPSAPEPHQAISTAYTLRCNNSSTTDDRLDLTVWEMSVIRDAMLTSSAAHPTFPSKGLFEPTARCQSGQQGIPAYKLAEPAGWLVRTDEIAEALAILRNITDQPKHHLWKRWLRFLVLAQRRGGFTVL